MTFIVLSSGAELDLHRPRPGHITTSTIAHALAQINRFTGHAARPYSVAEHSLLVADIMATELGISDPTALLCALLHDAHEAFCGDMHTPGKAIIGHSWRHWEGHWERAVQSAFAITAASAVWHATIKRADLIALATERRDLLPGCAKTPWPMLQGIVPLARVDLRAPGRCAARWSDWQTDWQTQVTHQDFLRNAALGLAIQGTSKPAACHCNSALTAAELEANRCHACGGAMLVNLA